MAEPIANLNELPAILALQDRVATLEQQVSDQGKQIAALIEALKQMDQQAHKAAANWRQLTR